MEAAVTDPSQSETIAEPLYSSKKNIMDTILYQVTLYVSRVHKECSGIITVVFEWPDTDFVVVLVVFFLQTSGCLLSSFVSVS